MIIIKHRVNKISDLKKTDSSFGVEIDLRSEKKDIYLNHDPFLNGELFSNWIKHFNHKLIVLNVKEEGLEKKITDILNKRKIKKFFFHDQTFSSMLKNMKKTSVSIRYSEYEKLNNTKNLFKYIKWVWIDNFNKIPDNPKFYRYLNHKKIKTCLVSPELVKIKRKKEIPFLKKKLIESKYKIDAVCTKYPNLWK